MEKVQIYDVVIIGNYTKDTIISLSGTSHVDGGGFNYAAHVAALMGLKAAAITRLAKSDSHVIDALLELGLDVYPEYSEFSTLMELYYPNSNVDDRQLTVTQTAGPFKPEQVQQLQAKLFLVNASYRGEVGLDVLKTIKDKQSILAADVQGFVRVIGHDGKLLNSDWPDKREYLGLIDILKTDAVEAESLTNESDMRQAAKKIASWGPNEIVLTHRDGLLVYANEKIFTAKFHPKKLVGRSGRGDTCIAAYAMKRLNANPGEATIFAAAVTSLKLENEGPIKRKLSDVEKLMRQKYKS